jgi:RNA binding exosome subunit
MVEFSSAEIRFITHATEDSRKVLSAVCDLLGVSENDFVSTKLEGHFGNEIKIYTARIAGRGVNEIADRIIKRLEKSDKNTLAMRIEDYVDKHGDFYLRFDKQAIVLGRLRLWQEDAIRVKLKISKKGPKDRGKLLRGYLEMIKDEKRKIRFN